MDFWTMVVSYIKYSSYTKNICIEPAGIHPNVALHYQKYSC